jgi:hypothetical protein
LALEHIVDCPKDREQLVRHSAILRIKAAIWLDILKLTDKRNLIVFAPV